MSNKYICPHCGGHIENDETGHRDVVARCAICALPLYGKDKCYYIDGKYYCEDCVRSANVQLDKTGEIVSGKI